MLLDILFCFDLTWFATVTIALVTYLLVSEWQLRRILPPGPTPLPFIGNVLSLRRKDIRTDDLLNMWRRKYGDVFTMWLGSSPTIVVCGWDAIRDGMIIQKNAFSGRTHRLSVQILMDGHVDVLFGDLSPTWEVLRKLILSAVRKYANSENLPVLVDDVVKQTLEAMMEEQGPVDAGLYFSLAIYNILASTAFGERYALNDREFVTLKNTSDKINAEFPAGLPSDFVPILRYFYYKKEKKFKGLVTDFCDIMKAKYAQHKRTYVSGVVRDFTDAMLAAKEEAEKEDFGTSVHFTDGNLALLLFDFFSAGTDTTRITMSWILLYLSNFPDAQDKVRKEVQEFIGDRMPTQEDKLSCPYTTAVITEVLRLRPVVSFTLEHKSTCDAKLGGYTIPKNTSTIFHIQSQHSDSTVWSEPEVFRPERFLNQEGGLSGERLQGYLPFGLGRRGCPGEKLAKADLFLLLTRMLQQVKFTLPEGPGSADLEPKNILFVNEPKEYKLNVEKLIS